MDPRAALAEDFPDLTVERIERIGEGWDHEAFLVNGTLVFRLAWDASDAADVRPEVALLRAVAGRLPIEVPEPVHVANDGRCFGYRYLPGRSVQDLLEDSRWRPDVDSLADLVTDVITAIEDIVAPADAAAVGLPVAGMPRCPPGLDDHFDARWAEAVTRGVVTLHADLGLDHWLVADRAPAAAPYALIDWSDSCVGPPELQLSTLMWDLPELPAAVAGRYARRTGRTVDGELIFVCGYANALGDLVELEAEADADPDAENDDDIAWCRRFLQRWSDPEVASTLRGVTFTG